MVLAGLSIGLLTDRADRISFTVVAQVWCYILNAIVAVLTVLPVYKVIHPGLYREKIPEAT